MNISVVVPLLNEAESLPELCKWVDKVMKENNFTYELILIDDGSKDNSWSIIESLTKLNNNIKELNLEETMVNPLHLMLVFQNLLEM